MLVHLSIRNVVLVKQAELDFSKGFCVLTGETGAGKSILLDALGFVIGARGSAKLVRQGEDKAVVTAMFDVSEQSSLRQLLKDSGIDTEDELILRRVMDTQGKSKAYANDQVITASLLKDIGDRLIEVHGQHAQKGLLDSKTNRQVLDQYGQLSLYVDDVAKSYESYKQAYTKLNELVDLQSRAAAEEEYLKYMCNELDQLDLSVNEDELAQKRHQLMNQEKMAATIQSAYHALSDEVDIGKSLRYAHSQLAKLVEYDPTVKVLAEAIERASIEVDEVTSQLHKLMYASHDDDKSLEQIEQKLFALRGVARKHHVQVSELKEVRQQMKDKLNTILNHDTLLEQAKIQLNKTRQDYDTKAKVLSQKRQEAAIHLEKKILIELADLKMGNTRFKVQFESLEESQWSASGIDRIVFLASTNPGSELEPLAKIASGGELSRFMLALKVCLSHVRSIPTLIFDEIDTGIGGATADAVGKRLKLLGEHVQVLAVTHQPQVASKGRIHFKIDKLQKDYDTETHVHLLGHTERQEEIARMLAGEDISQEARAAASKLLTIA